jgi:hypothetical protein
MHVAEEEARRRSERATEDETSPDVGKEMTTDEYGDKRYHRHYYYR